MTIVPLVALIVVTLLTWAVAIWASYDDDSEEGSGRVA